MRWKLIFSFCLLISCATASIYCWSMMPWDSVSRTLADKVQNGPGTGIDFADVAPFAWDRVFIFHPYTPNDQIDTCLGFHWRGARWSSIDRSDGINLVVFVKDGAVVCWFDHSRGEGDLVGLAGPKGFSRDEATFNVVLDEERRLLLSK